MNAPSFFTDLLARTFDNRLRIRWSASQHEFHIEQRVGRAVAAPSRFDEGRDDLIRARDGYDFVMSVRTGDRMPCPVCHYTLRVPVMDTWDIHCGYCKLRGLQTSVVAGFWPLNDRLISHLQKIDPLRADQTEQARAADRYNRLMMESEDNAIINAGVARGYEKFNRIAGIQSVGYTGKEYRGKAA